MPSMNTNEMRIKVPHLLIWGMKDTALLPKSYRGIEELSDDFKMLEIDHADHWLHHEQPDQVTQALLDWI
jgi:epoxide hydrolase 4